MFSHKTYCKLMMVACLGLVSTISTQAMALASAELYNTKANLYGRFEARIRFAAGDGVISSFFLWKEGSEAAGAYWNELDFEKVGADCRLHTNSIYGKPSANHAQDSQPPGLCDAYHDYRFEWTPTYIAWILDGKEIRRDTGEAATAYSQNATAGMTFHFNIWPGNQDFGGNINNTTLPVREYISWVQYSSYNNGSFQQEWREDFQGTELPEGWLAGDWGSPLGQSTHSPKNVGFVNGIAVLAITADNATGSLGTPPVDPNAGGSGGNGGSSGSGGSGGKSSSGASSSAGGASSSGGSPSSGGSSSSAGSPATGGNTSVGGTTATGGRGGTTASASGGTSGGAGQSGSATGGTATGGATSGGGVTDQGGQSASGASSNSSSSDGGAIASSTASSSSSGGVSGGSSSSASSAQGGSSASSKSASSAAGSSSSGGSHSSSSSSSGSAGDSSSGCSCRFGQTRHANLPMVILSLVVVTLLARIRRKGV